MPSPLKIILLTLLIFASISQAGELTLTTKQGFELKADFYQPKQSTNRAVLLLHQCNADRTMYYGIAHELTLRGLHALSLDFRWFGESVKGAVDIKELAKLPPEERKNPWPMITEHWQNDVKLAYDFLRNTVGKRGSISVMGASCGGGQIEKLAHLNPIEAIGFFSSAVVQDDKESRAGYKAELAKIPTLFIAAEQDATFAGTQRAFALNENIHSQLISYKGDLHGETLLDQDKHLIKTIANWFDEKTKSE